MPFGGSGPDWSIEGRDWPNRDMSRFVKAGPIRWHVQIAGSGPVLLLIHGTGAATHSWRDLFPRLIRDFTVVAPDLPGHGFTERPSSARLSLPGMARGLAELLATLDLRPELAVGHSAGAAILIQSAIDGRLSPKAIISLNGALLPFRGMAGRMFSPLAKLLVMNPLAPRLFAWQAGGGGAVERLIMQTGSRLDERGIALYRRLIGHPGHVSATLAMMANWDLDRFEQHLSALHVPLTLVVGEADSAVPPADARHVQRLLPGAEIRTLPALGHLAHEEAPETIAAIITEIAARP